MRRFGICCEINSVLIRKLSPIEKANLVSGAWKILILSNNGKNATDPIAYERDIDLVVGPQQTSTVRMLAIGTPLACTN